MITASAGITSSVPGTYLGHAAAARIGLAEARLDHAHAFHLAIADDLDRLAV